MPGGSKKRLSPTPCLFSTQAIPWSLGAYKFSSRVFQIPILYSVRLVRVQTLQASHTGYYGDRNWQHPSHDTVLFIHWICQHTYYTRVQFQESPTSDSKEDCVVEYTDSTRGNPVRRRCHRSASVGSYSLPGPMQD